MRELRIEEYDLVFGGAEASVGDIMAFGTGMGSAFGAAFAGARGLGATAALTAAGLGGSLGAGFAGSALTGYKIGQVLNEYTPIQRWIADGLEWADQTIDGDE